MAQRQTSGQGGHHDRRNPFTRATHHQAETKGYVLFVFQMLIVADQHDAVAGSHTQNREKTDNRTERDDTPADQVGCQAHRPPSPWAN